jgi:hypothetical protein
MKWIRRQQHNQNRCAPTAHHGAGRETGAQLGAPDAGLAMVPPPDATERGAVTHDIRTREQPAPKRIKSGPAGEE